MAHHEPPHLDLSCLESQQVSFWCFKCLIIFLQLIALYKLAMICSMCQILHATCLMWYLKRLTMELNTLDFQSRFMIYTSQCHDFSSPADLVILIIIYLSMILPLNCMFCGHLVQNTVWNWPFQNLYHYPYKQGYDITDDDITKHAERNVKCSGVVMLKMEFLLRKRYIINYV